MSEYQRQTYIGSWRTSKDEGQYHNISVGAPVKREPVDAERELGSHEVAQNTDTHYTLKRQGIPADVLRPAWQPVLDAARGLRKELDRYEDKDGERLTGKQKRDTGDTLGRTVEEIIGGKA